MQWWEEIDHEEAWRGGDPPTAERVLFTPRIDAILGVGLWMAPHGSHNWGLTRTQAVDAIGKLSASGCSILGLDVREPVGATYECHEGDFCDPQEGEADDAYVKRSAAQAIAYIERWTDPATLFELVPSSKSVRELLSDE